MWSRRDCQDSGQRGRRLPSAGESGLYSRGRRQRDLPTGDAPGPPRPRAAGSRKCGDAAEPGEGSRCARGRSPAGRAPSSLLPPRIRLPDPPRKPRRGRGPGGRKPCWRSAGDAGGAVAGEAPRGCRASHLALLLQVGTGVVAPGRRGVPEGCGG